MKKYKNFLTILLIVIIIAIIALIGYIGYDIYNQSKIEEDQKDGIANFENSLNNIENNNIDIGDIGDIGENTPNNNVNENTTVDNPINSLENTNNGQTGTSSGNQYTYKGYNTLGTISIPKLNIQYFILEQMSVESLKVSVVCIYTSGINEVGNSVIVGHNYRSSLFFSKIHTLQNGDEIYITDLTGRKVRYIVYNVYETTDSDSSYIARNTNGAREISLSTCTNDSKKRTIVWAKEG